MLWEEQFPNMESLPLHADAKQIPLELRLLMVLSIVCQHYFLFVLLIFGCVESSFLCEGFLQLRQAGATLHCGARASHCRGLSCCGAQAPDAQAQQLWPTGLVAPRHVGSSQTRAPTRVPCVGRQILNHCATREAPVNTIDTLAGLFFVIQGYFVYGRIFSTLLAYTHYIPVTSSKL